MMPEFTTFTSSQDIHCDGSSKRPCILFKLCKYMIRQIKYMQNIDVYKALICKEGYS
jgi:hypothetical protein